MTQLEVNDMPENTLTALQSRALQHHCRLNTVANSSPRDVLRQKREMDDLIGSWDDSRTATEIIADIKAARMVGREVSP